MPTAAEVKEAGLGTVVDPALIHKVHKALLEAQRQYIIREFRFDPEQALQRLAEVDVRPNGKIVVGNYGTIRESIMSKLRETQSETAFAYLLRYGINKQIVNLYEMTPGSYREWALITTSDGFENYYPAVFLPQRPQRVERGEDFQEVQLSGFQTTIRNYKYAGLVAIEEELWEDDQSGQIPLRAQGVGEGMVQSEEIFFYQQFFAAVTAGFFSAVGTQKTGGGALSLPALEAAWPIIRKIKDGDGNLIGVRPTHIVVDALDELVAWQIYDSVGAPQNPSGSLASATDQNIIYFTTPNPMKGRFKPIVSDFITLANASPSNANGFGLDGATAPRMLVQARKGVIFQDRTPLKVEQEAPNSGKGFTSGERRFSARRRFGAGPVEPRFEYILN